MIHSLLEVMISHIFREGNQGADWLANTGRTSKSYRFFWDHFPVQLVRIVENDLSTSIVINRSFGVWLATRTNKRKDVLTFLLYSH